MKIYSPNITGSLYVTGSKNVITGSLVVTQGITGSLFGTASYALSSNSASFATTSSYTTAISGTTNYLSKFLSGGTVGNSLIYDNGTRLGIGTTSPSYKLDVVGDIRTSQTIYGGSSAPAGTSYSTYVLGGGTGSYGSFSFYSKSDVDADSFGTVGLGADPESGIYFDSRTLDNSKISQLSFDPYTFTLASGGDIKFNTKPSTSYQTSVFIKNTGEVGIGTIFPTNKLTILGTDDTIPALGSSGGKLGIFNGVSGTPKYGLLQGVLGTGNSYLQVQRIDGTSTAYNLLLQPNGGNVGIGTVSPQSRLEIKGSNVYDSVKSITLTHAEPTYYSGFIGLRQEGLPYTNLTFGTRSGGVDYLETLNIGNGNVGIGTTSPSEKLDVNGNVKANSFIKSGGTSTQYLMADGSVNSNTYALSSSLSNYVTLNTTQTINSSKTFVGNTFLQSRLAVKDTSGTEFFVVNAGVYRGVLKNPDDPGYEATLFAWNKTSIHGNNLLAFQLPTSDARLRIRTLYDQYTDSALAVLGNSYLQTITSDRITVGRSLPTTGGKLEVTSQAGSIENTYFTTSDFTLGTTGSAFNIQFGAASGNTYTSLRALKTGAGEWSNLVLQGGGGKVGIGTTSPSYKLDVVGDIRTSQTIYGGSFASAGTSFSSYVLDGGTGSYGSFSFYSKSDVDVDGFGTVSLGADPESGVYFTSSNLDGSKISQLSFDPYTFILASGGDINFNTKPSTSYQTSLIIKNTGNVGIGTTTPSYPLYVATQISNTSIYAAFDIVAYSDISVKTNIRPIDNVLERVINSRGVLYDRIDSGEKNNIGFIAQELEEQFPELVVENPDGTKAVKYQNAVAILFEAIKEQQKQINELKNGITK